VVASIDYRRLVQMAPLLYLGGLVALVAVFALGRTVSGARRWLLIGPLSVQPSEMFKLCFVLMAVWLVTSRWAQPVGKIALILAAPVALIPAVLIVKQPDLGTALLLFPVLIALFVAAGLRLRTLGGLVLAGVPRCPWRGSR
jgi:rod shape determining protein RodA